MLLPTRPRRYCNPTLLVFFLSGGECEGGGPGGGDLPCNQIDNDNWDVVVDQDKLTGDRAP